jgi:hypothetical protein
VVPPPPGTSQQLALPDRQPRRRLPAWLGIASALALAVGVLLGFALGSARPVGEPASGASTPSPAARPAATPSTPAPARPAVTPACLEAARRGEQVIDLLLHDQRRRAADLLVPYTVASRQCRKDATPSEATRP